MSTSALRRNNLAKLFRTQLTLAGLDKTRPELFQTTAHRLRVRVHDLRGLFVTAALANGRSEAWISDRTGHRSSQMIHAYKRQARTFGELGLGDLTPLDSAVHELAIFGLTLGLAWLNDPAMPRDSRRGWDSNPRMTVLQTVA